MLELSPNRWQRAKVRASKQALYHKTNHGEKTELYMFARTRDHWVCKAFCQIVGPKIVYKSASW